MPILWSRRASSAARSSPSSSGRRRGRRKARRSWLRGCAARGAMSQKPRHLMQVHKKQELRARRMLKAQTASAAPPRQRPAAKWLTLTTRSNASEARTAGGTQESMKRSCDSGQRSSGSLIRAPIFAGTKVGSACVRSLMPQQPCSSSAAARKCGTMRSGTSSSCPCSSARRMPSRSGGRTPERLRRKQSGRKRSTTSTCIRHRRLKHFAVSSRKLKRRSES
mmetsp:Transcript_7591/g.28625  ORF Transcript_7591/g.28625 Transcript_7591/m.28625 type:complete len:222 (+) Transcript_7591:414-1079(+)